jgi:hypothetical protein
MRMSDDLLDIIGRPTRKESKSSSSTTSYFAKKYLKSAPDDDLFDDTPPVKSYPSRSQLSEDKNSGDKSSGYCEETDAPLEMMNQVIFLLIYFSLTHLLTHLQIYI